MVIIKYSENVMVLLTNQCAMCLAVCVAIYPSCEAACCTVVADRFDSYINKKLFSVTESNLSDLLR